jgi:hypothetical protein
MASAGFDQHPAGAAIAGESEAGAPHRVAGRPLAWDEAEKGHQLPRMVEAAQIADLGGDGDRDQERGAAHRLIGCDDRRPRPARHDRDQLLFQPPQPRQRLFDRLDRVLEHDLLGRMREALARQPAPVRQGPMLAAIEDRTCRGRNGSSCWRLRRRSWAAASRARTRSRTVS